MGIPGFRSSGLLLALVLSSFSSFCRADSGELALAVPVSAITADGDLSEWPEDARWYAIDQAEYGAIPDSASDFSGSFCLGYDADAVYVAVRVADDSVVINDTTRWNSQDGCSVYLDARHSEADDDVVQFNIYGHGAADRQAELPGAALWGCSHNQSEGSHTYEWKINVSGRSHSKLRAGVILGIDVSVCDKDRDRTFSWISWGQGTEKHLSATRLGDVLLIDRDTGLGTVKGRVTERSESIPLRGCLVRISRDDMMCPILLRTDSDGEFDAELPVGLYQASVSPDTIGVRFAVSGDQPSAFGMQAAPSLGTFVPVMKGKPQRVAKSVRMGLLHGYTWPDALRWGTVTGMAQDSDGALWIAGSSGLVHFDGKTVTPMFNGGHSASAPLAVAVDQQGHVWSGNAIGLDRYDGQLLRHYGRSQGLLSGVVRQIVPHADGSVFVRTDLGISCFSNSRLRSVFEIRDRVGELTSMAVESSGRVWLGTENGVIRLDLLSDGTWQQSRIGVEDGLPFEKVNTLLADQSGILWIGGKERLCRYDGTSFRSWKAESSGHPVAVVALAQTSHEQLWLGTTAGVAQFKDDQITHIASVGSVHSLFVDREENLWIGADSLLRLDLHRAETPVEFAEANSRAARCLLQTRDGSLWVGTTRGVMRFEHGKDCYRFRESYLDDEKKPGSMEACVLLEDSCGSLWIGTRQGLRCVRDKTVLSIDEADGLSSSHVTALTEDQSGRMWIGTNEGLTVYERPAAECSENETGDREGTFSHFTTSHGLSSNHIGALCTDSDGAVWIGSPYGTLCRFHNNTIQRFDDLVGVESLIQTSDGLLAGADGLYRFENDKWQRIDVCGKATVRQISPGARGVLWLATSAGLKVYDGFTAQTFSRDDGLREYSWDAVWDGHRSRVVVAAGHVHTYQPQTHAPPIRITGIYGDSEYQSTSSVSFGTSEAATRIAFHGTSYSTGPDGIRYRYRIRELDDSWTLTSQPNVALGRLPSGSYTFEVSAINRDLVYSSKPARVRIEVHPEYFRMVVTAVLVMAGLAVVVLSLLVVRRTRQVHALNRDLETRVLERTAALEQEVAEKRKLHDRLLQTQKLDAIGTLASGIAHDFNNSLAAISGFAEVAKIQWPESPEILDHILTASDQAAGTSRSLLAFSRHSKGEKKPCDLIRLVKETGSFLRQSLPASVHLSVCIPKDDFHDHLVCSIDESQIQQVLVNVVLNARDALECDGEIELSVAICDAKPEFARLVVTDSGPGMTAETQEHIFEPFFTTKARGRGTGLGLAMVHGIVQDHQGVIDVESSPGNGTRFSILLPRCENCVDGFAPAESESYGHGQDILVVDDNPDVRHMLVCQLASGGYHGVTAEDGETAMDLLQQAGHDIRLVLLDIDLPKKDGISCLEEISSLHPGLPVVLMSGLPSVQREQFDAPLLRKPFTLRDLLSTAASALNQNRIAACQPYHEIH